MVQAFLFTNKYLLLKPNQKIKVMGRLFTYTAEEFQTAWDEYFTYIDNNPIIVKEAIKSGDRAGQLYDLPKAQPYTEMGFIAYHGHGIHYITQLNTILASLKPDDQNYQEAQQLSSVLNRARAKCTNHKFNGAAAGIFNANIIARDLGLVDKQALAGDENGGAIKIIVKSKSGDLKNE